MAFESCSDVSFKAYYTNREKIRSLMRRGQTKNSRTDGPSGGASPSTTRNPNEASSQIKEKRSTTATIEGVVSLSCCPPAEPQTGENIQLASEEDMSKESDSLLRYGIIIDAKDNELNGTTYL